MGKFTVENKNILIVGLGKTGSVAAKALKEMGANLLLWDDKEASMEKARKDGFECPASIEDIDFKSLELVLWSPGIPHTFPTDKVHPIAEKARMFGVRLMSDINLFYLLNPEATYVGITGSNGKSTTTKLTYFTLQQMEKNVYLGGNIGSTIMFENPSLGKGDICVVELSSYQLELSPDLRLAVGALINITPDHLARHGGFEGYVNAKKIICNISDKLVIGVDDENTKKVAENCTDAGKDVTTVSAFGNEATLYVEKRDVKGGDKTFVIVNNLSGTPRKVLDLAELEYLKGLHNAQNIEVVYGIMKGLGLCGKRTMKAVKEFTGLEHRQQIAGTKNIDGVEVLFVNDSKATNAEAVEPALKAYADYYIYWIAGGIPKEGGLDMLERYFADGIVKKSFMIGQCEKDFAKVCEKYHPSLVCNTLNIAMDEIVKAIKLDIKSGEITSDKKVVVLLSPATASWDQYPSFEVRGNAFIDLYKKI
ncbi:MAG: UDP-N-acetylmuramoyl-L-alanine--D-glutamate ligase [Alphaproteobacteria bacterium]|jgi:UDP-N-acetylmuramoylalanine--D-glutamate ligase|nr:UDP-N-acetylmuramoyl-L-alanine--D-glutamate ligase [Alphaproteobacteria bacterium]